MLGVWVQALLRVRAEGRGRGLGGGAWPAPAAVTQAESRWPGPRVLPERDGRVAEVQGRQAVGAEQVRVGAALQQQLGTGRVAPQAGLVQGPAAAGAGVGVSASAEQVADAGDVASSRCDAQGRGELTLVLQGPEAWERGAGKVSEGPSVGRRPRRLE